MKVSGDRVFIVVQQEIELTQMTRKQIQKAGAWLNRSELKTFYFRGSQTVLFLALLLTLSKVTEVVCICVNTEGEERLRSEVIVDSLAFNKTIQYIMSCWVTLTHWSSGTKESIRDVYIRLNREFSSD